MSQSVHVSNRLLEKLMATRWCPKRDRNSFRSIP